MQKLVCGMDSFFSCHSQLLIHCLSLFNTFVITLDFISFKNWTKLQILFFIVGKLCGLLFPCSCLSFSPSVFSRVREVHRQVQVEDDAESSDPPLRYHTPPKCHTLNHRLLFITDKSIFCVSSIKK